MFDNEISNHISKLKKYLKPLGSLSHRALFEGYSLSINGSVFGMLVGGKLYLRACHGSQEYIDSHNPQMLKIVRRGRDISLNYYQVDHDLWGTPLLLSLSDASLKGVYEEKKASLANKRMKDLPNMNARVESLLWQAGIKDLQTFYADGAKVIWLKLRKIKKQLSVRVLFALEGAIQGRHVATLSEATKAELLAWYNQNIKKP